jgi:hypothetical protein
MAQSSMCFIRYLNPRQSDQIGRFSPFGHFGKLLKQPKTLGYFLSRKLILTKMAWATFWAIFSQTHLVTLIRTCPLDFMPT